MEKGEQLEPGAAAGRDSEGWREGGGLDCRARSRWPDVAAARSSEAGHVAFAGEHQTGNRDIPDNTMDCFEARAP